MFSRRISVGVLAGIVGTAMLIATSGPSTAFTLSSPSLEKPFVGAFVEPSLVGPVGPLARLAQMAPRRLGLAPVASLGLAPVAPLGLGLASARL
jgi:hypothetical protein